MEEQITCPFCHQKQKSLSNHLKNDQCSQYIQKVYVSSALTVQDKKICLRCGYIAQSSEVADHLKKCSRQMRSKKYMSQINSYQGRKIIKRQENHQQDFIKFAVDYMAMKVNFWLQKNIGINKQVLYDYFCRFVIQMFTKLPSVIPQFKLSDLYQSSKRRKIDWQDIVKQSADLFSSQLIMSRIKDKQISQKRFIIKKINQFIKPYVEKNMIKPFKLSKKQREVYIAKNPRNKLPLLFQTLVQVVKMLMKTNNKLFIHFSIDLLIIFQSGLRFPSSLNSIEIQINRHMRKQTKQLSFEIIQTKTKTRFLCTFNQQLVYLMKKVGWKKFSLQKKQYERLSNFLPFTCYSLRRGFITFLLFNNSQRHGQSLKMLSQHKSQQNAMRYAMEGVKYILMQVKEKMTFQIPETKFKDLNDIKYQIDSIKLPQNWFQKAYYYLLKYFARGQAMNIYQQNFTPPNKDNMMEQQQNSLQSQQSSQTSQIQEQQKKQIQNQPTQNQIQNQIFTPKQIQNQKQQIQMDIQNQIPPQSFLATNKIQINKKFFSFKKNKFDFSELFLNNQCTMCQKMKTKELFCECWTFNTDQIKQNLKVKKKSQLNIQSPQQYIDNNVDYFNQVRFLIHARNYFMTNVNVQQTFKQLKVDKDMREIDIKYFNQYKLGRYFPPLYLKRFGISSSSGIGFGLFAAQNIKTGVFIAQYAANKIYSNQQRFVSRSDMIFGLGKDINGRQISIAPLFYCGYASLINQTTVKPNCAVVKGLVQGKVRIIIYTIMQIKKNQQLFYNYGRNISPKKSKVIIPTNFKYLKIKNTNNLCYLSTACQILYQLRQFYYGDFQNNILKLFVGQAKIFDVWQQLNSVSEKYELGEQHDAVQAFKDLVLLFQAQRISFEFMKIQFYTIDKCLSCKNLIFNCQTMKQFNHFKIQNINQRRKQEVQYNCYFCPSKIMERVSYQIIPPNTSILMFDQFEQVETKVIEINQQKYQAKYAICRSGQNSESGHYWFYDIQKKIQVDSLKIVQGQVQKKFIRTIFFQKMTKKADAIPQIPIFQLQNLQQIKDFRNFVDQMEGKFSKYGAVKIKFTKQDFCDKFLKYVSKNESQKITAKKYIIKKHKKSYSYQNIKQDELKLKEFCFNNDQITQQQFWSHLQSEVDRIYSPDNNFSILNNIEQFKTKFNDVVCEQIQGINSPFIFLGQKGSLFGMHSQDYNLNAINIHLYGKGKIWYFIPPQNHQRVKTFFQEEKGLKCGNHLIHKTFLINPNQYQFQFQIKKTLQLPNQMILTFSKAIHWGFNLGFNANQAFNVGQSEWFKNFRNFQNCECDLVPKLSKKYLKVEGDVLKNLTNNNVIE